MSELTNLFEQAARLLDLENPPIPEVRKALVEMDEFINSPEFQALEFSERTRIQNLYQDLRSVSRGEKPGAAPSQPIENVSTQQIPDSETEPEAAERGAEKSEHNPYAEQQMEEAEKLFYGGRYAEAIKLYDQVLQIESNWERARQHRRESENYLRTGYIPSVALPAEAATAFGKAQSAARLGRYEDAMVLLNRAQGTLRDLGIQRWQEGQEFEQKLQQYIDAASVYAEGLDLFKQGMIDEGIDRVETSARATGLPKYEEKVQNLRKVKNTIQSISEMLNTGVLEPKAVSQARTELDGIILEYGENSMLEKLKNRLESVIPQIIEPMKDQANSLKRQADHAQTLEAARTKALQARQILEQAHNLGYRDDAMDRLQADVDKLLLDVQRNEDELQQSVTLFNTSRSWPSAAWRLSQNVRARYPNDPGVVELARNLASYRTMLAGIKVGAGAVGIALVVLIMILVAGRVRAYIASVQPTPTATPTFTATATLAPTLTPTFTTTPRPTLTPSITPTPLTGVVARTVWARNGCYENFTAIGQIPEGSTVRFLPSDRRFDSLNRECLLVEYQGPSTQSVIGWILIEDLQ